MGAPDTPLLWGVLARQDLVTVGSLVAQLQGQDSIQQLPSCTCTQRLALQPHVKTARACDDARMLLNSAKPNDSQDARQLEYVPHGQQERSKIHAVMQPPVPGLFLERQLFANRKRHRRLPCH